MKIKITTFSQLQDGFIELMYNNVSMEDCENEFLSNSRIIYINKTFELHVTKIQGK